jgi:antitoxin ParD1/3/4
MLSRLPFGIKRVVKGSTMNISITPELEKFVEEEVKTGLYQSASEVIRAGLRRLKEDKEAREQKTRFMVSSMAELEDKLLSGVRQLDRGEGIPGEVAFARLKERAKARGTQG